MGNEVGSFVGLAFKDPFWRPTRGRYSHRPLGLQISILIVLKGPIHNPRTIRSDFGAGLTVGFRNDRLGIPSVQV